MIPENRISITSQLGIVGWQNADAIILAALAQELPVLLVGTHGTGKTQFVQKLAQALNLSFCALNASMLSYEDLTGLPMPDDDMTSLRFIPTPASIWDKAFLFVDELSRCRPDMQNKLYPIVHERKLMGIDLPSLRHRWAAMNPPSPDVVEVNNAYSLDYIGAEPLDPALADRFTFFIWVPNWTELSLEDRMQVIYPPEVDGETFSLPDLIKSCQDLIPMVREAWQGAIISYVLCAMDLLGRAGLPQSPRRANMLGLSLAGIHAARIVLEGNEADLETSAELSLLHGGVPELCSPSRPSKVTLLAIHRQAFALAQHLDDQRWWRIYTEPDLVVRIRLAMTLDIPAEDFAPLVTEAIEGQADDLARLALALALYIALHSYELPPLVCETLALMVQPIFEPRNIDLPSWDYPPALITKIVNMTLRREIPDERRRVLDYNFLLTVVSKKLCKTEPSLQTAIDALNKYLKNLEWS